MIRKGGTIYMEEIKTKIKIQETDTKIKDKR
jgi:hypothetical protein